MSGLKNLMRPLLIGLTAAIVATLASVLPRFGATAEPGEVVSYQAEYTVRYKGRRVADAVFSVAPDTPDHYRFSSSTQARGLLRLASPNAATEQSRFAVLNDRLQPIDFRYADGSRQGEDNYSLEFDVAAEEVRVTAAAGTHSVPLAGDLLDRGTLQVALMRDLAACNLPTEYRYVDDDGINLQHNERLENLPAETGIGTLPAVRIAQQKADSSRRTVLWLAPDLAYLPVRIEQFRDGELETEFSLTGLTGIERSESPCSGFR